VIVAYTFGCHHQATGFLKWLTMNKIGVSKGLSSHGERRGIRVDHRQSRALGYTATGYEGLPFRGYSPFDARVVVSRFDSQARGIFLDAAPFGLSCKSINPWNGAMSESEPSVWFKTASLYPGFKLDPEDMPF
jgi:hypothetical protein